MVLTFPVAFLVFHGDAMEIQRHAIQIGVQIRLGLWMASFVIADAFLAFVAARYGAKKLSEEAGVAEETQGIALATPKCS